MARRLKGLDQITAWFGGIAIATGIMTAVWYGAKYYASTKANEERSAIDAVLSDVRKSTANDSSTEHQSKAETPEKPHGGVHPAAKSPLENYGYTGNLAPWYWANLNEKWKNCASKVNQSPIDLSGAKLDERLKTLKFFYQHGITTIYFEHQTVKGKVERGSYVEWDGERFDLENVYFRTPSEHRVNSLPYELEAQLEHTAVDGRKLMVATLFTTGKSNDLIERVAKNIPPLPQDTREIDRANWIDIFPLKKTYWTYVGSSTTPPCSPDVRWIIFTQESFTNKAAIDQFVLRQKANARPVYTLGDRRLVRSNR